MDDNFINDDELYGDIDMNDEVENGGLFEDSIQEDQEEEFEEELENPNESDNHEDYLTRILREKGIDRKKVRFENESGEIEEHNFDDLSDDDKYAILNDYQSPITDDELNTLNYLRKNNMTIQDFANWQRDEAVKQYLAQNQSPKYEIDDLSDDEMFAYDLMTRFGDEITDEEIDNELNRAKENEDLFKKQVGLLRTQYKAREDANKKAEDEAAEQQRQKEFNEFVDEMVNAAQNVQEIQGVELEDEDREHILDFLLKENPQGKTGFSELLSDPDKIFKMAWFALYGEDTFNSTVDYFKNELAKARRGAQSQQSKPKVVTKQKQKNSDPLGLDSYFENQ